MKKKPTNKTKLNPAELQSEYEQEQWESDAEISRYICSHCGGDHIGWDAWADENGETISVMDHHECLECESTNCAILVSDLQKHADSIVAQIAEGAA